MSKLFLGGELMLVHLVNLLLVLLIIGKDDTLLLHGLILLFGQRVCARLWMLLWDDTQFKHETVRNELDEIIGVIEVIMARDGVVVALRGLFRLAGGKVQTGRGVLQVKAGEQRRVVGDIGKCNGEVIGGSEGAARLTPLANDVRQEGVMVLIEEDDGAGGRVGVDCGVKIVGGEGDGLANGGVGGRVVRRGLGVVLGAVQLRTTDGARAKVVGVFSSPRLEGRARVDSDGLLCCLVVDEFGDDLCPSPIGELGGGVGGVVQAEVWREKEDGGKGCNCERLGYGGLAIGVGAGDEHVRVVGYCVGEGANVRDEVAAVVAPVDGEEKQDGTFCEVFKQGIVLDVVDKVGLCGGELAGGQKEQKQKQAGGGAEGGRMRMHWAKDER